jgi:adenylate cyclase
MGFGPLALAAAGLVLGAGLAARMALRGRRAARLRRQFFALPPAAHATLVKDPIDGKGDARTITYLSCRLPDTAQLEQKFHAEPARFVRLLDGILQSLTQCVLSTGGTVVDFSANGFSACWNAPLTDINHAAHACSAASRMLSAMQEHNRFPLNDANAPQPLTIAIGIATGSAIAGVFSERWSLAGDCVTRAEELHKHCAALGFSALADAATHASTLQSFALLDLYEPNGTFALLGDQSVRASPKFRALSTFHERIFAAISAHAFTEARELIAQARKLSGASQKLYDGFIARIAQLESVPTNKQHVAYGFASP